MSIDPYRVLGVPRDASAADIKRAYRKAAKHTHPDTPEGNTEKFERVRTALMVLSDDKRRQHYDETGEITEPQPDNELAYILEFVSYAMDMALGKLANLGKNGTNSNLIAEMMYALADHKAEWRKHVNTMNRAIAGFEHTRGRFKKKNDDGSPNWMDNLAQGKIDQCRQQVAIFQRKIDACDKAMKMVQDYSYEFETKPAKRPDMTLPELLGSALGR